MTEKELYIELSIVRDGKAHVESRLITPWWSFSKTALAAVTLVLVRDGKLSLDAPFRNKKYTLRHLLQHTSGLTDYGTFREYQEAVARGDNPWSIEELLEKTQAEKIFFDPGTRFSYSNIGYFFIRREIERITGKGLEDSLNDLVFNPLQISGIRVANSQDELVSVPGVQPNYHPGWVYHGLLVGSLFSAALFLDRLLTSGLLSSDLKKEMLTPYLVTQKIPGRPFENPSYGLGIMIGAINGATYVGHTGQGPKSTIAVYSQLGGRPTKSIAAFVEADGDEKQGEIEEYVTGQM